MQADKKERAERSAREKALRDGNAPAVVTATTAKPSSAVKSSENPETRLQVRTSKGPITKTFPSDSSEYSQNREREGADVQHLSKLPNGYARRISLTMLVSSGSHPPSLERRMAREI